MKVKQINKATLVAVIVAGIAASVQAVEKPGLSSRERDKMKINPDGSVTLSFGPKAPKGYENDWISTAGKVPFPLFRFYGPTERLFDGSFVLNDVELVK